jgi:hypothetical protein
VVAGATAWEPADVLVTREVVPEAPATKREDFRRNLNPSHVQSWTRSAPHEASEATPPAGSPIEPFRAPGIRLSSPNAAVLARRRAARATNRSRSAGKRRPGRFGVEIGSVGRILEQEGFREERETSGLADEAEAATGQRRATTPLYLLLTYCSLTAHCCPSGKAACNMLHRDEWIYAHGGGGKEPWLGVGAGSPRRLETPYAKLHGQVRETQWREHRSPLHP